MNIRKSEVFRQQKEIDDRDRQHRGLNHRLELMMEWDVQSNLRKKEIHKAKVAVTQRREREKEEAAKKALEKVRTACHGGALLALALLAPPCRQLLTGIHDYTGGDQDSEGRGHADTRGAADHAAVGRHQCREPAGQGGAGGGPGDGQEGHHPAKVRQLGPPGG